MHKSEPNRIVYDNLFAISTQVAACNIGELEMMTSIIAAHLAAVPTSWLTRAKNARARMGAAAARAQQEQAAASPRTPRPCTRLPPARVG